jgi:hypothetical protein
MSQGGGGRGSSRVPGKTAITVYLPDELVAQLRKDMEGELRGLSATVQIALEGYLADKNPETARKLRAALEREGYPTT